MNNKIKIKIMSNQITLFFILFVTFILFAGCASQKSDDTILSIGSNASPTYSDTLASATTHIAAPQESYHQINPTSKRWGSEVLTKNGIFYYPFESNASFELSLGDISLQQNKTPGTESTYIVNINMTTKNSGMVPVEVIFLTSALEDDSGDGCQSDTRFWCGVADMDRINPKESRTKKLTAKIFSDKGYEDFTSQEFFLDGIIDYHSDKFGGIIHKSWVIDFKKLSPPGN
jgi:hypothetical protein